MSNIARKNAVGTSLSNKGKRQATKLTYAGTLPLLGCIVGLFAMKAPLTFHLIASAYAAVIIAFICGIHWATYLFHAEKCSINLLLTSNVIALVAWFSLLVHSAQITYLIQVASFVILLLIDFKLHKKSILPKWFWQLRCHATLVVCLALSILLSINYLKLT